MMIWQDAEMVQAKNRTDAYDGDHNTVLWWMHCEPIRLESIQGVEKKNGFFSEKNKI